MGDRYESRAGICRRTASRGPAGGISQDRSSHIQNSIFSPACQPPFFTQKCEKTTPLKTPETGRQGKVIFPKGYQSKIGGLKRLVRRLKGSFLESLLYRLFSESDKNCLKHGLKGCLIADKGSKKKITDFCKKRQKSLTCFLEFSLFPEEKYGQIF